MRQECGRRGGKTSHRRTETLSLSLPPPCLVLHAVRDVLDPSLRVESLPLRPSSTLMLFGKSYTLVSMSAKTGTAHRGHWIACVKTTTGWYQIDDATVSPIQDLSQMTNGVHFLYEEIDTPLFTLDPQGLPNPNNRCWANAFTQVVRYSPTFASRIGITGRLPSVNELLALIDPTTV